MKAARRLFADTAALYPRSVLPTRDRAIAGVCAAPRPPCTPAPDGLARADPASRVREARLNVALTYLNSGTSSTQVLKSPVFSAPGFPLAPGGHGVARWSELSARSRSGTRRPCNHRLTH